MPVPKKKKKKVDSAPDVTKQPVRIRMYDVGFGDAFLVFVPCAGGVRKMLFDCGSIARGAGGLSIAGVADAIVADARDADGVSRIDVVVCTHRHKDHVAGFESHVWDAVQVREVWMPWTEDPSDPDARRIVETQASLAASLVAAFAARAPAAARMDETSDRTGRLSLNALSNEDAMATLHKGFANSPARYFLPEVKAEGREPRQASFTTAALPGVMVHVFGPSRDEKVIRDMDPPKGKSFLRMAEARDPETSLPPAPFGASWRVEPSKWHVPGMTLSQVDRDAIQEMSDPSEFAAAVALDKAVNGTSLLLVFEIGRATLVFPGDAQWGTWAAAMERPEFTALLARTTFYKVGHHGSHNATPKSFVEETIPDKVRAMVSTRTMSNWPEIPRKPLLAGLAARRAEMARSDEPTKAPKSVFKTNKALWIETEVPT